MAHESQRPRCARTWASLHRFRCRAQTLAIACYDIAEFIKIHPEGRRIMTQIGAKQPAMDLLKHTDPEVCCSCALPLEPIAVAT